MDTTHVLADILLLLAAAIVAVPLFQRLKLGSVLGYLAAGSVIGPWGLGFIGEVEEIRHIAEFGVVFLLFIIGIELKPERLWAMRRSVFGLGSMQVMVTGALVAAIVYYLGQPISVAVIIGFGLALSSTAFGLQILNERGELGTPHGRTSLSILLFQDLAVVPLLTLVSLLSADPADMTEGMGLAILKALSVIVLVVVVGRYLVSPILKIVATSRTREVFTAAAVLAVLGTAWLMETAGLSLALGAFLAGLMMAESHYRHQLVADIDPFRGILLGLFFMAVGMSIDFGLLAEQWLLIIGLVCGLLLLKIIITWASCRIMGIESAATARVSLLLSQSGEFGFVIFGLAVVSGLLVSDLFRLLVLVIALTMATTPLMRAFGDYLSGIVGGSSVEAEFGANSIDNEKPRAIIAGFGRIGRRIAMILDEAQIPYIAIENDADRVLHGRHEGRPVYYGDASQVELLKTAGAENADVLVCTLNKPVPALRMISIFRETYPHIAIHARGHNHQHCQELLEAGASIAVSETLESSLQLGDEVLTALGYPTDEATALVEALRSKVYS